MEKTKGRGIVGQVEAYVLARLNEGATPEECMNLEQLDKVVKPEMVLSVEEAGTRLVGYLDSLSAERQEAIQKKVIESIKRHHVPDGKVALFDVARAIMEAQTSAGGNGGTTTPIEKMYALDYLNALFVKVGTKPLGMKESLKYIEA